MACFPLFPWSIVHQSLSAVSQPTLRFDHGESILPFYWLAISSLRDVWMPQPFLRCLCYLASYIETLISYLVYNRPVLLLLGHNKLLNTSRC